MAELSVGVSQDWITFELAVSVRNARLYTQISEETRKLRKYLQVSKLAVFTVTTLIFALFVAFSVMKFTQYNQSSIIFNEWLNQLISDGIGYAFLG